MIDYKSAAYLQPILSFLEKKDIPFALENIKKNSFLPGILIQNGTLIIDTALLQFPGDVLHEAGHIAVAPPATRMHLSDPISDNAQLDFDAATHELMTLAWSYAAAIECGIPPEVVFHPEGYKGQHQSILYSFQTGQYIGLPMLQWLGMAYDAQQAHLNNAQSFPHMIQWLRPPIATTESVE